MPTTYPVETPRPRNFTSRVELLLPPGLKDDIRQLADESGRSFNAQCRIALVEYLKSAGSLKPAV